MATGSGRLHFVTNRKKHGAYESPSFRVRVPGDGGAGPKALLMVLGSWSESTLQNGNTQITFRVLTDTADRDAASNSVSHLARAIEFFAALDEEKDTGLLTNTYSVGQQLNISSQTGWARVIGGTIAAVDGTVLTRWHDDYRDRGEWIITFERHKYFETTLVDQTSDGYMTLHSLKYTDLRIRWNVYGNQYADDVDNSATDILEGLNYRYGPGRWAKTRVRIRSANRRARTKRVWLGIQENRLSGDGALSHFYPSIEPMAGEGSFGNVTVTDESNDTTGVYTDSKYYSGASNLSYIGINWNEDGVTNEWRRRFLMPMVSWSGNMGGSFNNEGNKVLWEHRGRYRLLMRYRTNQPTSDNNVLTGIRGLTVWLGHAIPTTWQGEEHWIGHKDFGYHWLDLGEIEILGNKRIDPDYQINMSAFSIGLDAMSVNVPTRGNWDSGLDYGLGQYDYGICPERFHLIPADKYMYIELPGGGMTTGGGLIDVYIDDDGQPSAWATNGGVQSGKYYDVSNITTNNWSVPIRPLSHITGVIDYGDHEEYGPFPRNSDVEVEFSGKIRTRFDYMP